MSYLIDTDWTIDYLNGIGRAVALTNAPKVARLAGSED